MGKRILFILLLSSIGFVQGQSHEIGLFLGGSNYVGDIGRTNYIYPNEFAGGIVYKYNLNPRIALRANYNLIPISGNDKDAENAFRQQSGRSFTNTIHEFAAGVEFNFYEYNIAEYRTSFTPYILAQIATINHKSFNRLVNTNTIEVKNSFSYALPVGIGIKGRLTSDLAFAVETGARYTFTDQLDYSTSAVQSLNFEGNGNDWYFFSGISIVYTFGRPACYNGLTK
ncbi:OMP_b-brl domain-containing protein [Tenacibaculum sp. 190130A14a]|uniref:OMP_b-brl domain-containing protein n=1 Tax=Tenacibaculum polynesiense TaxID=3137857 RepID=A0ABM9P9M6_9FLAO